MLQYLLELVREEAATVAQRETDRPTGKRAS